jgi:hypothetical protein
MDILIRVFRIDDLTRINIPINIQVMKALLGNDYLVKSGVDDFAIRGDDFVEAQPLCGRKVVFCPKDGNFYVDPNIWMLKKIKDCRPKRGER